MGVAMYLLVALLKNTDATEIVGLDVAHHVLQRARERLRFDRLPPMQQERIRLIQGALTYRDERLAGFDADSLFGIYAPAGTPPAVVTRLHAEINKALQVAAVTDAIKLLGAEPAPMSREEFLERHVRERERFGGLVKDLGLKVD
jgi:hypothetical protein